MKSKHNLTACLVAVAILCLVTSSPAQETDAKQSPNKVLIKNVSIFDGTSESLITGKDVVLVGNKIDKLIAAGSATDKFDQVIDGQGGYLSPGLIDCHWHSMLAFPVPKVLMSPQSYLTAVATWESEKLLMRGVTTIRDAGGNTVGLQKAIDEGYVKGPRIYPSQAVLSQYSGHTDFRNPSRQPREWGGPISVLENIGMGRLCNGRDQVLAATRDNLYQGATQVKMAVSGGVISFGDPLYVNEFLPEEIEAAVQAAEDFGTYVMVHVHNSSAIQRAILAGVKSLDHCSLADEETVRMMAKRGVYITVQPLTAKQIRDSYPKGDVRQVKAAKAYANTANVMKWVKAYDVKMGWGTDLLDSLETRDTQLQDLTLRKNWFSSSEIMIQATGMGGEIVSLCGKRNPYGKLGVIEAGAMADVLLYSKNPLEDVAIVEDFENNLKLIMKDGKVYKNTLTK